MHASVESIVVGWNKDRSGTLSESICMGGYHILKISDRPGRLSLRVLQLPRASQMLQSNGTRHRLAMRADGGSSPMFAGACASQFVPSNTIAGTVEYLPNIGYVKDDEAETGAIGNILRKLRDNGALAFAINIVSGSARWQRDHRPGSICSRLNVPAISAPLTSP